MTPPEPDPAAASRARSSRRWIAGAFLALSLLHVAPLWLGPYTPTTDGPSHLYNAWILRGLLLGDAPPAIAEHYELNLRPYPNWLSHAAMAGLMGLVSPPRAEKVLASAYVLLLAGGVWTLVSAAGSSERWLALLAFPFVYNLLFQYGFYNFSLGLALLPWVLGQWWRHRERPTLALALRLNLLLLLCWFAHPMPFALALAAIGVLWLATLPGSSWHRHLVHVVILLPQVALPAWYLGVSAGAASGGWETAQELRYLAGLRALVITPEQGWLAASVAVTFLLLLARTLWLRGAAGAPRRPADAFLLLAALALVVYLASPTHMAGGGLVKERLSLLPYLLALPALATGWRPKAQAAGAVALAGLALADLALVASWTRERGRELAAFTAGLEAAPRGSRVVSVVFRRRYPVNPLGHATGYAAITRGLVDWDNYEAKQGFFPTRFRDSVAVPTLTRLVRASPERLVARHRSVVDVVYTWRMPAGDPQRRALRRHYRRAAGRPGGGEVWVRRARPKGARGAPRLSGRRSAPGSPGAPAPRGAAPPTPPPPSAAAAVR